MQSATILGWKEKKDRKVRLEREREKGMEGERKGGRERERDERKRNIYLSKSDTGMIWYYELLVNKKELFFSFEGELWKRVIPVLIESWFLLPGLVSLLSFCMNFAGEQGFEVFRIYVESSFMGHGSCNNHGHCFGQWRSKLLYTFKF